MKRNYLLLLLLLSLTISCKRNEVREFYASGNLKSIVNDTLGIYYYDTEGEIVFRRRYRKPEYDSVVTYYKNGKVYETGKKDFEDRSFGNWNRFTKEGLLSDTWEYLIIKDEVYLNRHWYFGKNGDTLWYATKFNRYDQEEFAGDTTGARHSTMIHFPIYTKDTISLNQPFLASVICNSPVGRQHNSEIMMLLAKEDHNFNETFSNEHKVKFDTFYNVRIDEKNRDKFTYKGNAKEGYNYIAAFGRWFKTPGKKVLRGYMREFYTFDKTEDGGYSIGERSVYFEKEIFVKDSLLDSYLRTSNKS